MVKSYDKKNIDYIGRSENKLQSLKSEVSAANKLLKANCVRCQLFVGKNNLAIRYTPPGGSRKAISPLGVTLTSKGIQKATQIANDISDAINAGIYSEDWLINRYYPQKIKLEPIVEVYKVKWGDILATFADRWLEGRAGDSTSTDRQKQVTLTRYLSVLRRIEVEASSVYDAELIKVILSTHAEGTDKRFRLRELLSIICTLYEVPYDFKKVGRRPKPKDRIIPTDNEIIHYLDKFETITPFKQITQENIDSYRWLFGILATYGLRPQELRGIDLVESFKPEYDYWIKLDETLADGLKTGDRWIPPLPVDWLHKYNLSVPKYPETIVSRGDSRIHQSLRKFVLNHIGGLKLYDLRHAYAHRCRLSGVDLLDASDALGHDPRTHSKHYHRHISIDARRKSFAAALERSTN